MKSFILDLRCPKRGSKRVIIGFVDINTALKAMRMRMEDGYSVQGTWDEMTEEELEKCQQKQKAESLNIQ